MKSDTKFPRGLFVYLFIIVLSQPQPHKSSLRLLSWLGGDAELSQDTRSLRADGWYSDASTMRHPNTSLKLGSPSNGKRQSQGQRRLLLPGPTVSLSRNNSTGRESTFRSRTVLLGKAVVVGNWRCHVFGSDPTQFYMRQILSESRVDQPGCV